MCTNLKSTRMLNFYIIIKNKSDVGKFCNAVADKRGRKITPKRYKNFKAIYTMRI